jgi:4-hydroxybenzoate-CoA ligase
VLGICEDDICLSAAKLFFAYGLGNALTFPMSVGATTVLNSERPTPALIFALMNKYNPTIFFGVPTLYSSMLNDETLKNEPAGSRLRICTSAGEALPESVGNAWKARFGVDILDGVGSTELLHIFLSNAPGDIKYGTSGRPVPGYKVRLVNDAGDDVPDGEVGELLVDALPPARATGTSAARPARPLPATGPAPATNMFATPTAVTPSAAAATTCSRCPASGCRRSRSRAR